MTAAITPEIAAWLVQLAGLALVGFLLRRAISGLDESLRDIKAQLHALDSTDKAQGRDILEQGIRLRHAENQIGRMSDRQEDFGRFLQGMGFWKRDGGGDG